MQSIRNHFIKILICELSDYQSIHCISLRVAWVRNPRQVLCLLWFSLQLLSASVVFVKHKLSQSDHGKSEPLSTWEVTFLGAYCLGFLLFFSLSFLFPSPRGGRTGVLLNYASCCSSSWRCKLWRKWYESPFINKMCARCVIRSSNAAVIVWSTNTLTHSPKSRFVVTIVLRRSWRAEKNWESNSQPILQNGDRKPLNTRRTPWW